MGATARIERQRTAAPGRMRACRPRWSPFLRPLQILLSFDFVERTDIDPLFILLLRQDTKTVAILMNRRTSCCASCASVDNSIWREEQGRC